MEKPTFTNVLSFSIMVLSFAFIFMLFFVTPPEANSDNINMIVGFLVGTGLNTVINYYLGSSSGSEKKTEIIKDLASNQQQP